MQKVYVRILDQIDEVWGAVDARYVKGNVFELLEGSPSELEYSAGDMVLVSEEISPAKGKILFAYDRI